MIVDHTPSLAPAPPAAPFHQVNDDEWNEDSRAARVALDPCIQLVETFANGK